MRPTSSGGVSEDSGSDDDDRPPLNLHINQHSNLYKYNNQFTIAKKAAHHHNQHHKKRHPRTPSEDGGDDHDDRPDTPIQVA